MRDGRKWATVDLEKYKQPAVPQSNMIDNLRLRSPWSNIENAILGARNTQDALRVVVLAARKRYEEFAFRVSMDALDMPEAPDDDELSEYLESNEYMKNLIVSAQAKFPNYRESIRAIRMYPLAFDEQMLKDTMAKRSAKKKELENKKKLVVEKQVFKPTKTPGEQMTALEQRIQMRQSTQNPSMG